MMQTFTWTRAKVEVCVNEEVKNRLLLQSTPLKSINKPEILVNLPKPCASCGEPGVWFEPWKDKTLCPGCGSHLEI